MLRAFHLCPSMTLSPLPRLTSRQAFGVAKDKTILIYSHFGSVNRLDQLWTYACARTGVSDIS